jgi:hypothetical protein
MSTDPDAGLALERARAAPGIDPIAARQLGVPIRIRSIGGEHAGWFVPEVADDRIAGFVQLDPAMRVHRRSSFRRSAGSLDGCPSLATWTDPATIRDRATAELRPGESPGEPFLSFDGVPDRLAWVTPTRGPQGGRLIFVAGDYAYSKPWEGDSTG